MERVSCDFCGKDQTKKLWDMSDKLGGKNEMFTIVECFNCGLVYVNPRPDKNEINLYYPRKYEPFEPLRRLSWYLRKFFLWREVWYLKKILKPDAAILEIGSGSGQDLAYIRDKGGWSVLGVDLSENSAKAANGLFSLEVRVGTLESMKFPDSYFDYIRMKYVLSHVHSPKSMLKDVFRILKPGGKVFIWIPNFYSLDRAIFRKYWQGQEPPRHLYDFSEKTILAYLKDAGFKVENIKHSIIPNTWIHSFRNFLEDVGLPPFFTGLFHLNPFTLFLFLPVSVFSAIFKKSDRLFIVVQKL